jgi:hypothetical protein
VRPPVRTGAAHAYGSGLEQVRRELGPALLALEGVAAAPDELEDAATDLPALQYALHVAGERVVGLEPLPGLEEAHEELAVALAIAREETADVLGALERDDPTATTLVWEWRAALFGVRLALGRIATPVVHVDEPRSMLRALVPVLILFAGVLTVLGGALAELWPVWTAGLGLVALATSITPRP